MLKRRRAIAVVGVSWASVWAVTGVTLNVCRFLLRAHELGLEISIKNLWGFARVGVEVGGSCGFVAGVTFGVMLTVLPPMTGSRISRRWSVGYGVASGMAASLYILHIGYGTMMLPFFAGVFSLTGAVAAVATAALASREPVLREHEESAASRSFG